jgi:hypothetical protein
MPFQEEQCLGVSIIPPYFATTNGAATSGNGIVAILRAASSTSSGSAVLTFTLSQSGCDDIVITQAIWVGLPDFGIIYNDPVCVGDYEWAFLDLYGARAISLGTIDWTFSGVINGTGTLNKARFRGMTPVGVKYASKQPMDVENG